MPDVAADGRDGRHKYGFGLNGELPLADAGASGLFMRVGWNDGATESFVFTEVDQELSAGGQLADRDYLAAGGSGFLLGDGRLNYAHEQILETYYRLEPFSSIGKLPLRLQLSPDFQFIRNPGFNKDRGPVRFYALRVHLEY